MLVKVSSVPMCYGNDLGALDSKLPFLLGLFACLFLVLIQSDRFG